MKKTLSILLFALCMPWMAMAEEVEVTYMITTTTDGSVVETRLDNAADWKGPRLIRSSAVFLLEGTTYALSQIEQIRFEKRTEVVDAIAGVVSEPATVPHDNRVYSINGQVVREGDTSLQGLPAGLYIVNGRKVLVK